MRSIMITGGASGLGALLAEQMRQIGWRVYVMDRNAPQVVCDDNFVHLDADIRDESDIREELFSVDELDVLVNCAGINKLSYLQDLDVSTWDDILNTNARAIMLMSQAVLPIMLSTSGSFRTICNVVSNASHMPMTASIAYNASKGAAHIMTLQMARELSRRYQEFTVFGISPNKLAGTGMSRDIEDETCRVRGWTPEEAAKYQLASLLSGEETDPLVVAEFLAYLLADKRRHQYLTGCIMPYGA